MNERFPIDPNDHDHFILKQKFRWVINEYNFFLPGADEDTPGRPFCFVRQARFKFKEDIRFYTDDSATTELMRIKARQRFDPWARYDVTAADGSKVGEIQKVFSRSLLRSSYLLCDPDGKEVATATEKNVTIALLRRLARFVPYVDDFANWLPIPYHFVFSRNGTELGIHRRHLWKFTDVYTIDLSGDPDRTVDRRLVLAIAVAMDALQAR
jgi:uncharacterized protein YxjI